MVAVQTAAKQLALFPERGAAGPSDPGEMPRFSVRESARAKRLSIKVYPRGRVEVVVPRRTRATEVQAFVVENRDWIARSVAAFQTDYDPAEERLPSTIDLQAIGRKFVIVYRSKPGGSSVRCRELGGTLVLSGAVDEVERCRAALKRWLAKVARREFEPMLRTLSVELELPFDKVQIRAQKTCWGSRSCSGTVSLNLCLLFVRPKVLRYLMVHELSHGRHMDHSAAFWRLVARHEPNFRRYDRALGEAWREVPSWINIS